MESAQTFMLAAPEANGSVAFDALSLKEVYAREFNYVFQSLKRLGVAPADLEDAAHETFLAIQSKLSTYNSAKALRPWLFGFAFRIAARFRKRNKQTVEFDETTREVTTENASDLLSLKQRQALFAAALESLSLDQRALFLMIELDGFSMPEACDILSLGLNTGYSRLRLARERFERSAKELARKADSL